MTNKADNRSGGDFSCWICICIFSQKNPIRSPDTLRKWGRKNQNKPEWIRVMAATLGVDKSTNWFCLKKEECTDQLSSTKKPERPREVMWILREWVPWLRNATSQYEEHFWGAKHIIVKVYNPGIFMNANTAGLQQGATHWLHSRTGRLDQTARKHPEEQAVLWRKFLGQMKSRSTCTTMMGREKWGGVWSSWSKANHIICGWWKRQCYGIRMYDY